MAAAQELLKDTMLTLSYRFGVFIFAGGLVPNPVDFRFKRVSGLSSSITTSSVEEGGQNLYTQKLPDRVQYENLVLERGVPLASPLGIEFNVAMSNFSFSPSNVLVTLFNEGSIPQAAWLFMKAYPVKWAVTDLDADSNTVVVETMELAYQRMQVIRL